MSKADWSSDSLLQDYLTDHADDLRRYVAGRTPALLVGIFSAEDILQEAWIAAFRMWPRFRMVDGDALGRWVTTIVDHKLVDAIRAARRHKRDGRRVAQPPAGRSVAGLLAELASGEKTPSGALALREAADAIRVALASLSEERRQAITLRYIEGLPNREIAAQMGKSEAAVHSLLYNGLRGLRARLGRASKYFSDAKSRLSRTVGP